MPAVVEIADARREECPTDRAHRKPVDLVSALIPRHHESLGRVGWETILEGVDDFETRRPVEIREHQAAHVPRRVEQIVEGKLDGKPGQLVFDRLHRTAIGGCPH
jgi:hypothetical protein